ncbi:MAG: ABC transporter permease [Chitinispirillales bacterium]|jgi:peptide/nickel transport system permease protein|nr:ABC transporter permease [Chitinispirillales bacterium]
MKLLKNLLKSPMFVIGTVLFFGTLLVALFGPLFYNITMVRVEGGQPYAPLGGGYMLGLDHLGRDYVSLLLSGLRSSLYVGFLAGIIATTIGTLIGIYGGFRGGLVDDLLNMMTNLFVVIPQFVVLILISSSIREGRSLTLIAIIIGMTGWTWSARAVRAQASALKSKDHISLARLNGDNVLRVILVHILPYIFSYVFMVFIIQVASGILSESAISMIGLGPLDTTSLGTILNDARNNGALGDGVWWAFVPATVVITVIVFALYLINTSMEGVFNPRLRK